MKEPPIPAVQQPDARWSRWWGALAALLGIVVAVLVGQFEPALIAKAAGTSAGCIFLAGWIFWDDRRERWFWPYIALALMVHGLLITFAPWPGESPAGDPFKLIMIVDMFATISVGWLASKLPGAACPNTVDR